MQFMRKQRIILFLLVILTVFVGACGRLPSPEITRLEDPPTQQPIATVAATSEPAAVAQDAAPATVSAPIPTPPPTEIPTDVPTATPTLTPTPVSTPTPTPTPTPENLVTFRYRIDRSAVPFDLYFQTVTLEIEVGNSPNVSVYGDGQALPFSRPSETTIVVSTEATELRVGTDDEAASGAPVMLPLKDGKSFAWSHGMDDNASLQPQIDAFNAAGYAGTVFLITGPPPQYWNPERDREWIFDPINLIRETENGWSFGVHNDNKSCDPVEADILAAYEKILAVAAESSRPDYRVTGIAAPCGNIGFLQILLDLRDSTDLIFVEGQGNGLIILDQREEFSVDGETAAPLNLNQRIGREWLFPDNKTAVLAKLNWMALNSSDDQHFWLNTFSHGNNDAVGEIVETVKAVYDEVIWVAPSDQVVAHALLYEFAEVELVGRE